MNMISKMRITHKISALMIGLVAGFIAIGITYYIQINISQTARDTEKAGYTYQQKIYELKQLELIFRFQSETFYAFNSTENLNILENTQQKIHTKLTEIQTKNIDPSLTETIANIVASFASYSLTINENIDLQHKVSEILEPNLDNKLSEILSELEMLVAPTATTETLNALKEFRLATIGNNFASSRNEIEKKQAELFSALEKDTGLLLSPNQRIVTQQSLATLTSRKLSTNESIATADSQLANQADLLSNNINHLLELSQSYLNKALDSASGKTQATQASVTAIIFLVAMATAVGIYFIYKSIVFPMAHMQSVINRINRGKTNARVRILSNDELGDLGLAFNKLFDERIHHLESQSKENEKLNNSIISLIRALGAIAKKDLTIKVPVSSDITGTISDAVNLFTSETSRTLSEVKEISREVNSVSEHVQEQSMLVSQFAESERKQIIATSKALRVLASAMTEVAQQSERADVSATKAISSTRSAKKTVVETVNGIRTIRETISETEKRMKRLGDRSQEVSGIVNLINTIAERTHILALNASMHAASAGEAGKGFAVVAEEVQRLAESARTSTDQIAAMVNNMRVETSDTVTIMNTLISQVAEGSKLAEQAGREMESTEETTKALVETVKRIAAQAVQQASLATRIRDRTTIIRDFSDKTENQLSEQKAYTDKLMNCAATLLERVNVFRLPQDERIGLAKGPGQTSQAKVKIAV
ncbi:MAG: twitching motility protein PilJ [Lentisphaeria bacterium]|jgi:twitching motility protein PilJ